MTALELGWKWAAPNSLRASHGEFICLDSDPPYNVLRLLRWHASAMSRAAWAAQHPECQLSGPPMIASLAALMRPKKG